jgi:glycosyltransferase involved in cell wall biosynthesis
LKVPVCASNVVALTEQVGDAGILFVPNDVYDMAEKKFC